MRAFLRCIGAQQIGYLAASKQASSWVLTNYGVFKPSTHGHSLPHVKANINMASKQADMISTKFPPW